MTFSEFRSQVRDQPTFVILGVQGSGTNLLSRILNRAFGVSVVRDRSLILSAAASLGTSPSRAQVADAMNQVYRCLFPNPLRRRLLARQWYHQAREYEGLREHLDPSTVHSAADLAEFFYAYHAYVANRRHKAIKSDDCWQHLDEIPRVLPERRYILLARDPRDNALSIINKDFGPRTIYTASHFVRHQLELYLRETGRFPELSLIVKYESLLESPEQFVERFATFSGISPTEQAHTLAQDLNIREANHSKWMRWSRHELAVAETVLRESLERLDYGMQTDGRLPLPLREIARYRLRDVARRVPQRLKSFWDHKVLAK